MFTMKNEQRAQLITQDTMSKLVSDADLGTVATKAAHQ